MENKAQTSHTSVLIPEEGTTRHPEGGPAEDRAGTAALEELKAQYESNYRSLFNQALSIVRSPEAADDIVQETFANTAEAIEEGTEVEQFNPWLNRCVRNLSLKYIRTENLLPLDEGLDLADEGAPAELVHASQRCKDVYQAINELAPHQKSALVLFELRGLSYGEIAATMGRTTGSVRQLIRRARIKICDVLGPRRALSLTVPLLLLLDAEARGHLSLGVRARFLPTQVRAYFLSKFAHLRALAARSLPSVREIGGTQATAIAAGVLTVVAALGPASTEKRGSEEPGSGGAPVAAATPLVSESASPPGKSGGAPPTGAPTAGESPQAAVAPASDSDRTSTGGNEGGSGNGGSSGSGGTHSPSDPSGTGTTQPGGSDGSDHSKAVAETTAPGAGATATNEGGSATTVSNSVDVIGVPEVIDPPTISVQYSEGLVVRATLVCSPGTWRFNPTSFRYFWIRDGWTIAGATDPTYPIIPKRDAGSSIWCGVSATNPAGSSWPPFNTDAVTL